jgi:Flp pilus assembly protein TadG
MIRRVMERVGREERGSVLVIVAVALPVFVIFAVLVVDVASWYVHRNHLQLQADAAAFAGAREVVSEYASGACIDDAPPGLPSVTSATTNYSGGSNGLHSGTYNQQVKNSTPASVPLLINSKTWPSSQPSSGSPDDTDTTAPCSGSMVDVKMTDKNVPGFFGPSIAPDVHAHARVSFVGEANAAGNKLYPIAIPESNTYSTQAVLPYSLVAAGSGSNSGTVDCVDVANGNPKIQDELEKGCAIPPSPVRTFTSKSAETCASFSSGQQVFAAFPQPQSVPCVPTNPGNVTPMGQGLDARFTSGNACTAPNNWPPTPASPLAETDKRLVQLFVVRAASADFQQGNKALKITGFAYFYIVGWGGQNKNSVDPCLKDVPAAQGEVKGFFVRYVPDGNGDPTSPCSLTSTNINTCVTQLTR